MKKTIICTLTVILLLVAAGGAMAGANTRVGDKNFERAWRLFTSKQGDKANDFFKKAADSYGLALQADPPNRTALFPSSLLKAGISFYYAGRYKECLDAMEMAHRKEEKKAWEASLYMALSYARLDNREKTIETLEQFNETMSSQRRITAATIAQLQKLDKNETTLEETAAVLEHATMRQFVENTTRNTSPRNIFPAKEQCGGGYWWRQNASPCSSLHFRWD
ncbi:tetratricopeptide repeat protein [Pseudodesulfovibrio sediminis]|uniref:Tetratricopeptide repeat protein n=1 Tax=Pseudodesulfovibrio sediminis TaxID=2810563 RepID=A0ABN6ET21_9BACT|nr:tetratricopeptide repeat protein [Pseudodesulfovibrio sediminis]BCS88384.1 hypothetical protein PSDVSF_16260 [Pseudodesulfovibrio sediminis]